MNICWNEEKNILLQNTRHVSFQQVEKEILLGNYTIMPNKNYPHQEIFVVPLKGYPYCVPFVQEKNTIFLKTIYPNRKLK